MGIAIVSAVHASLALEAVLADGSDRDGCGCACVTPIGKADCR